MATLNARFKNEGTVEGEVQVDISYDIIKHVSSQLYTNPRKAIEELVCNSYDAGATECHVQLPKDGGDALVVLDNGKSMDFQGLRALWKVADSPKKPDVSGRRVAHNRLQIGKFGVGKLWTLWGQSTLSGFLIGFEDMRWWTILGLIIPSTTEVFPAVQTQFEHSFSPAF